VVFATEGISRTPQDRPTTSALWKVRVDDGQTELLYEGDAVQPSWSPNGHRIAFWGLAPGTARRDIYTIPADGSDTGGERASIAVTEDEELDWNPVWSPDGRYIYYSSDRGGSMNLWRIPVDERDGTAEGPPEPVRAPSTFASHVGFSRDGARMVYTSTSVALTLESVKFDPVSATAGSFEPNEPRTRHVASPAISPDAEWIAISREGIQEDIVLVPVSREGEERQLTDDGHRDRSPRWSPDGERIAFYSNRGGTYEVWSVRRDGSDLKQHTDLPELPTRYPFWSPDGSRMLFSGPGVTGMVFDPNVAWGEQEPERLPPYPRQGEEFVPLDWSSDGKWLAGYILSEGGVRAGIGVYSFDTGEFEALTGFGVWPKWLNDSRRVLFQGLGPERSARQSNYELQFKTFVVDRESKVFHEVFSLPGASVESPTLTPGNETLYFVRSSVEADIWLLDSSEAPAESEPP
jgi:Tol biopolymer transport system component